MSRTLIWAGRALVLAATMLFSSAASNPAMARGGGHGGGGHGGGFHGGGFHGGGFHGGGFHGGVAHGGFYRGGVGRGYYGGYRGFYGGRGLYARGFYGRGWGYPYYGWGYGLGGYWYPGYSYYSYPYYSSYPYYYDSTAPSYYDVVPPQYTSTSDSATTGDNRAHLMVQVPDPNAQVTINGQKTQESGMVRYFESPELSPGNYSYEVQATWQENGKPVTQSQTVKVQPGAESLVTFTAPQQ